jgi:hypothetical protein
MVLGMTSPALFRELFAEASQVPAESLATWFDQKTATFGGRDVIATVKEIVGNCDRFDFQTVGRDVPPVDLPDLRPFVEAMLVQNRRRPRRGEDGSLTFKTPEAWLQEVGVRSTYEGLVFDRSVRGKDAVQRVVGVGHKILDQALNQALEDPACVATVSSAALPRPMVVARVIDRVTSGEAPIRCVVVGVERSDEAGAYARLRDWEVVRRLNEVVGNVAAIRKTCAPPADRGPVKAAVEAAVGFITAEVPKLDLGFRVPSVEVLAVLWPGVAILANEGEGSQAETDATDEFSE